MAITSPIALYEQNDELIIILRDITVTEALREKLSYLWTMRKHFFPGDPGIEDNDLYLDFFFFSSIEKRNKHAHTDLCYGSFCSWCGCRFQTSLTPEDTK